MSESPLIIVVDSNEISQNILKSYFEDFGFKENIKFFNDIDQAIVSIKEANSPIVIMDYEPTENILDIVKLHTNKIILMTTEYSTDIIIKSMRLGAKDVLPKPIIKTDLKRVLDYLILQKNDNDKNDNSKIITIYSNKGGIGKTTIATNLAVELAKVTNNKVALIDLNLQLGDVSTFLNLNPKFDLGFLMKNLIEKKEDTLLNAFEKYKDSQLYVLSDPNYIEEAQSITPYKIEHLFNILKKIFSYIVIDMSSNLESNSLKILDISDLILFTSIVNIPAIRNCQRCLNLFNSRKYPDDKVKVVINRYMENDDITTEDIETAINKKVFWKIPNNYFSIMEAINKGVPVREINSNSNISNSFRDLATKISDEFVQKTLTKYRGF